MAFKAQWVVFSDIWWWICRLHPFQVLLLLHLFKYLMLFLFCRIFSFFFVFFSSFVASFRSFPSCFSPLTSIVGFFFCYFFHFLLHFYLLRCSDHICRSVSFSASFWLISILPLVSFFWKFYTILAQFYSFISLLLTFLFLFASCCIFSLMFFCIIFIVFLHWILRRK